MRKTKMSILIIVLLSLSMIPFSMFIISGTGANNEFPEYQPIDIGYKLRNRDMPFIMGDVENIFLSDSLRTAATEDDIGTQRYYVSIDSWYGGYFGTWMELMAVSDNAEVWVQLDLSWPDGDTRPVPVITTEQCQYLANEFDSNIYPTDTNYFGMPLFREGWNSTFSQMIGAPPDYTYDPEGKSVILVSNLRDQNYYDPTFPYFVIGTFSPTIEGWFGRNVVSLDAYNWDNYLGEPGHDYEATLAHEYQHLIHNDYQATPTPFMNEGCSMFAEFLCGYPLALNDINSFLATPDNSLTQWGDQGGINILADYGQALLFATYLVDQFGDDFLKEYVQNGVTGVEGINAILPKWTNFDKVFHDWRLANLIHSGTGKYNYKSFDLNDANPVYINNMPGTDIPWTSGGDEFGNTFTILGYDTGISLVGPYGTDYIAMNDIEGLNLISFKGDKVVDTELFDSWIQEDGFWYSGDSDLRNVLISAEVYVDPADPYLELTTYWDIEDYWDFGFVQVSTDGGNWDSTWTSLENEYTTWLHDPNAHPDIVANLPGLTSWSGFLPEGPDVTMMFDLSAYAGETIHLGFRYMTDWGTTYEGWILYDVKVSGTEYLPNLEPVFPEIPINWMVSLVEQRTLYNGKIKYNVQDMHIWEFLNNLGLRLASLTQKEDLILVVSPMMESVLADYSFSAKPITFRFH